MSTVRMRPLRRPAGEGLDQPLPPRPRRRLLTRGSAAMAAVLACAIGFYAGVRIEKGQLPASSATTSAAGAGRGALAALLAARAGGTAAAGGATGVRARAGTGGLAGLFGGGGAGGGAALGTVSTVDGRTLYVTEASGNTVKVKLSSQTRISKMRSAGRAAIRPGDTIVVQGVTGSGGTVTAASVTDSGVRGGGAGTGGSAATGAGSAIGSLFTAGG